MAFQLPPIVWAGNGRMRRVGAEIEFTGLSVRGAAEALTQEFGGTLVMEDAQAYLARATRLGDLTVELDSRHLHPRRREATRFPRLGARSAALVGWMLGGIVPCELITAPLPMSRLAEVDQASAALRRAGARGAGATLFASLGMHLNVEVPCLDSGFIAAVLKAYLLSEAWLRREARKGRGGSWAARSPRRFPDDYARQVVAPGYWPELPRLAADYLAANPTRDRGLDLLPILLHLDETRVRSRLPHEKIRARPAFHYRLPFAYVSDAAWSIGPDWNRWTAVERLAGDRSRLSDLGRAFLAFRGTPDAWADIVEPADGAGPALPVRRDGRSKDTAADAAGIPWTAGDRHDLRQC